MSSDPRLATATRAQRRQAARDALAIAHFADFIRQAAELGVTVGVRDFIWSWHNQVIADEMEAVARGEVRELVVCIPPGCGKSLFVSVMFQAWDWLHHPSRRSVALSANDKPVKRDAIALRQLVQTAWYRRLDAIMVARARRAGAARRPIALTDDQNEKANYVTTSGGQRVCATMGSHIIGERYDGMIVDDPVDPGTVLAGGPDQVRRALDAAIVKYDELESRLEPWGWRITIMQMVASGDLASELLKRGVRHVVIPMEGEPEHPYRHPRDLRAAGELLLPHRYDRAYCDKRKHSSRPDQVRRWLAQYQQRPEPMGGRQFDRAWFARPESRYTVSPERMAAQCDDITISVDCTFKGRKRNDRVAMFVAGKRRSDGKRVALDLVVGHMDFVQTLATFRDLCARWPRARVKLIEGAANGPAVISAVQGALGGERVSGVIEVTPQGGKEARAAVSAVGFEAGDWLFPAAAPWLGEFVEEHVAFAPGCDHDDIVDAVSQLAVRWESGEETFAERMERTHGRR